MINKSHILFFVPALLFVLLTFLQCNNETITEKPITASQDSNVYLNHNPDAKYVGMQTCKQCHQKIYESFSQTGMGQSFDLASKEKSAADFTKAFVKDASGNFFYQAYWEKENLFIKEYRVENADTVHQRLEQVNYIIGSGQHTNSHIQNVNGYLHQMPMTYYTQKKKWDLPPGFENGFNTHFNRKIGLECMSCHNAFPDFVLGSENKFTKVPSGIDCERCHGPGSFHVNERQAHPPIDTSRFIDYSIVNPAKLSVELQFDICQRCHLQGNAVLKNEHSFYDFIPGKKLSDYISVFLSRYNNSDEEFIMASHADRLKQSPCFIKSLPSEKDAKGLRPYKDAMTCVTCHNPHISVKHTGKEQFNSACNNCHQAGGKSELICGKDDIHKILKSGNAEKISKINCVTCHMPASGSIDIPHVSVHDHFIRKPITQKEKEKIKTFLGLYSVNEKNPDAFTRAKAYVQQYVKFEQNKMFLDSAENLLRDNKIHVHKKLPLLLEIAFCKQDFNKTIIMVKEIGEKKCLDSILNKRSYDNTHAWACYHVGEAYFNTGAAQQSLAWFKNAVNLAPFNLEFRNKYGSALGALNNLTEAAVQFEKVLEENPKNVQAYTNLGYIKLREGFPAEALRLYKIALALDPDNEALLLNLAGYHIFKNEIQQAKKYIEQILKLNPKNEKAKLALRQILSL